MLTLFVFSFALSLASACQDYLSAVNAARTPSPLFLAGDDFATEVLSAAPPVPEGRPDSIWLEFTDDPRYLGERGLDTEALQLALGGRQKYLDRTTHLWRVANAAKVPFPQFIVTWRTLGVRAINRLVDRRVYPAGLVDQARVDGSTYDQKTFLDHDLAHALGVENIRFGTTRGISNRRTAKVRQFHRNLRYVEWTDEMVAQDHLLFDIGYFLYFHEFLRSEVWDNAYGAVFESKWRKTQVQMAYGRHPSFNFLFSTADELTAKMTAPTARFLISRFLDPGDLYVNLPRELKLLLRERPGMAEPVLTEWLNQAFTVFFRVHYAVAKRELGITPSR